MDASYRYAVFDLANALDHYLCSHADALDRSPDFCASGPHVALAESALRTAAWVRNVFDDDARRHRHRHRSLLQPSQGEAPWPQPTTLHGERPAWPSDSPHPAGWLVPCPMPDDDSPSCFWDYPEEPADANRTTDDRWRRSS